MDDKQFSTRLKICAFRSITAQLMERGLVTEEEFQKIKRKIDRMEKDLVAATPNDRREKVTTVVE